MSTQKLGQVSSLRRRSYRRLGITVVKMPWEKHFEEQFMEVAIEAPTNFTFRKMTSVISELNDALFEYNNGNIEKAEAHLGSAAKLGRVPTFETWAERSLD